MTVRNLPRREFLKTTASGLAARSLLPAAAQGPSGKKMIGIQVGAISFVDEGVEQVLDILQQRPLSVDEILQAVADFYRISVDDLKGRSRNKEVVIPRQMATYLLREETGTSLPQIGDALGGRDHTTIMYSVEKMTGEIETDDQRRKEMLAIKERLYEENRSKMT